MKDEIKKVVKNILFTEWNPEEDAKLTDLEIVEQSDKEIEDGVKLIEELLITSHIDLYKQIEGMKYDTYSISNLYDRDEKAQLNRINSTINQILKLFKIPK